MDHFQGISSSTIPKKEPIILDMIIDSTSKDEDAYVDMEDDGPTNTIHP